MLKGKRAKKAYPQFLDRLNSDDKIESKEEAEAQLEEAVREQYDCDCLGSVAVTFLTADCFLGPRTAENHSAHDDINFLLSDIRNLSTPTDRRTAAKRIIVEFQLHQAINREFDGVPRLAGWRFLTDRKCVKVYEIDGRYFTCEAVAGRKDGLWSVELFWSDEYGLQPCVSGASLLEAAKRIEDQIEILRLQGHNHVDCEGLGI